MLKKQHILLGILFLGIFIKPMEKSYSKNMALGGVVSVAAVVVGIGGYHFFDSCEIRKQLCKDVGPSGSKINIYSGVPPEEEETYNGIRIHNKVKSNLPYFGISDTNEKKYTTGVLQGIDASVKSKHVPSLWDIFKGRSRYDKLNAEEIKKIIVEKIIAKSKKKFEKDLICGWLETNNKGVNMLHMVRCLNNKYNKEDLSGPRLFEAWHGNTKKDSCKQLFVSEKLYMYPGGENISKKSVNIVSEKIEENSFVVIALYSRNVTENDRYIVNQIRMRQHCKDIDGPMIVGNVKKMINRGTVQEIQSNCDGCFDGVSIEKDTSRAITVVTFYNGDEND